MSCKTDIDNPFSFREKSYLRIPIQTRILATGDDMLEIVREYTKGVIEKDDIIVISESPLAITQGRAIPVEEIKVGLLASILWRFVGKVRYGIGLRSPTSMQCAIEETGHLRILLAAIVSFFGKLIGRKGDFYRIAGMQAALVDAAHTSPVPPYNSCVIKGPKDPAGVAKRIKNELGYETAIMDINDIGGSWVIGCSEGIEKKTLETIMLDNPQGQGAELTPICLVRLIDDPAVINKENNENS
ncbi:MAG: coenzyme F420-0:L-glutamate ligase [Candidatus Cloacimonetes bacterium]|nr:coenzyme F420-0:L-glutamate ligase [Candidatus Cloacimonadota bacterium]